MAQSIATKERPILFKGAMVRAILDGTKTQTRRVVKTKNENKVAFNGSYIRLTDDGLVWNPVGGQPQEPFPAERVGEFCPYGKPGDLLWVRETWANISDDGRPPTYVYRADEGELAQYPSVWKPSIHMPRPASRITLLVKDVRVERVQDISSEDAYAEGILECDGALDEVAICNFAIKLDETPHCPRPWFATLWDSINSARGYGWDSNPWVWVVEFEKV